MPHIHIKIVGQTEEGKANLAEAITQTLIGTLGCLESNISVAIEDIPKEDWPEKVYRQQIMAQPEYLYKAPGYAL